MTDFKAGSCADCIWWSEGAPPTSTATRNIKPVFGIGTCERLPPTVISQVGIPVSLFPETAGDRSCGWWECDGIDDGGDGGERVPSGEVIPIRRDAAIAKARSAGLMETTIWNVVDEVREVVAKAAWGDEEGSDSTTSNPQKSGR